MSNRNTKIHTEYLGNGGSEENSELWDDDAPQQDVTFSDHLEAPFTISSKDHPAIPH